MSGESAEFSGGDGKVYFLDFWATWCSPCDQQARYYLQFEKKHAGEKDIEIMRINADGVSAQEQVKAVKAYLHTRNLRWDPVLDQGKLTSLFEVTSFPTTVAIDKNGRFIFVSSGLLQLEHLEAILEYGRDPEPVVKAEGK